MSSLWIYKRSLYDIVLFLKVSTPNYCLFPLLIVSDVMTAELFCLKVRWVILEKDNRLFVSHLASVFDYLVLKRNNQVSFTRHLTPPLTCSFTVFVNYQKNLLMIALFHKVYHIRQACFSSVKFIFNWFNIKHSSTSVTMATCTKIHLVHVFA